MIDFFQKSARWIALVMVLAFLLSTFVSGLLR
jgi:hypothetical protein